MRLCSDDPVVWRVFTSLGPAFVKMAGYVHVSHAYSLDTRKRGLKPRYMCAARLGGVYVYIHRRCVGQIESVVWGWMETDE